MTGPAQPGGTGPACHPFPTRPLIQPPRTP